jgi:uncharacterized membrane protein
MSKDIAVAASVDIGKNITELLEKLAGQIGTTADKVFPWYVTQQVIEGTMLLATSCIAFIIGMLLMCLSFKKADWNRGNRYSAFVVVGAFIAGLAFMVFIIGLPTSVAQIINPEYYALKSMTCDMAMLLGK